jgi:hypothetical protein
MVNASIPAKKIHFRSFVRRAWSGGSDSSRGDSASFPNRYCHAAMLAECFQAGCE